MSRRGGRFLIVAACLCALLLPLPAAQPPASDEPAMEPIVGMYIHQHWPYNYPYAARTWRLDDWRGFLGGLNQIGYNAVLIWPMLETMPDPLTRSDEEQLRLLRNVIALAHQELGMRVFLVLCPNVAAVDEIAARQSFQERHFFYSDRRVDPRDAAAMDELMTWREHLLAPLKEADGVMVIDSDPGGFPGSTNEDFIALLARHRMMLDHLRPGIRLFYWVNAGWPAYSRFYATGRFRFGEESEFLDVLDRLAELDPQPWALAGGLRYAERAGLSHLVLNLSYGAIEGEPTFPLTRFTPEEANRAGGEGGPLGVLGNAQTHVVQLPNIFAFARGAHGQTAKEDDLVRFADGILPGHGETVLLAWKGISSPDLEQVREARAELEAMDPAGLSPGPLAGLIFGDAARYVEDLLLQLELQEALQIFLQASRAGNPVTQPLHELIGAAEQWQARHGYQNRWKWPELEAELRKLHHPALDAAMDESVEGYNDFDGVKMGYFREETATPRLLRAMRLALQDLTETR